MTINFKQTSTAIATLLLSAMTTPAFAQSETGNPNETFNWDRFYGGIFFGIGAGTTTISNDANIPGFFDSTLNLNGGLVGLTLGKNVLVNDHLVVGIEGDFANTSMSNNRNGQIAIWDFTQDETFTFESSLSARLTSLATLRGRIGMPVGEDDKFMPFLTAGLAAGYAEVSAGTTFIGQPKTSAGWLFGYTVGGGVEYAITENFTLRADYLFVDLSGGALSTAPQPIDPLPGGTDSAINFDFRTNHLVRFGMNAHF